MPKLCTTLALICATFTGTVAMGQTGAPARTSTPPAARSGTVIAVVDMLYIMNKHDKMLALNETSQKKTRELQASVQTRGKELQRDQEKLRELKVGSDAYRALQETLAERGAKLEADARLGDAQIKEDHLKAQLDVLIEVQAAIKNYADRKGIDLVVNFDGEPASADKLETSARAFRSIVQYQNDVDITMEILKIVSPPTAKVATKTNSPAAGGGKSEGAPVRPQTTRKQ